MNKKFRFDGILNYRKQLVDQATLIYSEAKFQLDLGLKALDGLYQELDQNFQDIQKLRESEQNPIERLRTHDEFFIGIQIRIDRQREKVRQLKADADEKQQFLIDAMVEYKSLVKLQDRHHEKLHKYEQDMEQEMIDDMVVMRERFRRK